MPQAQEWQGDRKWWGSISQQQPSHWYNGDVCLLRLQSQPPLQTSPLEKLGLFRERYPFTLWVAGSCQFLSCQSEFGEKGGAWRRQPPRGVEEAGFNRRSKATGARRVKDREGTQLRGERDQRTVKPLPGRVPGQPGPRGLPQPNPAPQPGSPGAPPHLLKLIRRLGSRGSHGRKRHRSANPEALKWTEVTRRRLGNSGAAILTPPSPSPKRKARMKGNH